MRFLLWLLILFFGFVGILLGLRNVTPIDIDYYFGIVQVPSAIALSIALLVGGVVGLTISLSLVLRLKRNVSKLRKTVNLSEREIENLRKLSIQDRH